MADEGGVPPLEDMSELIDQVEALKEHKGKASNSNVSSISKTSQSVKTTSPAAVTKASNSNVSSISKTSQSVKTTSPAAVTKETKEQSTKSSTSSQPSNFGGFKKGFMFSSPSPKSTPKTSSSSNKTISKSSPKIEEIPYIKPKDGKAKEKQYQMPEVQEAMKASQSILDNKEWVSDDLLERVEKSPHLMKYLADPRFSQALAEFQTNPHAAQMKYADNKEIQVVFKEFCGLLGDHFSKLGVSQPATETSSSSGASGDIKFTQTQKADIQEYDPNGPTPSDERQMQEILASSDIRETLMDPQVQKLFEQLRTNPSEAQKLLQTKDPGLHQKISKLVAAGLLKFQM